VVLGFLLYYSCESALGESDTFFYKSNAKEELSIFATHPLY
jgi:hypothetical protein